MTSTWKGGGGDLKFVTCLQILFSLNNRPIVNFCLPVVEVGRSKIVIFCGRRKWMTPYGMLY